MEQNPLISIILPVYNGEKYLAQSIESCLKQTYNNIELIIVNDCSTDASLEIMNRYKSFDGRVIVINNTHNQQLPKSLNIGHQAAKGAYLTWTSDDNTYAPNAIEKLYNAILNNNADISFSDYERLFEDNETDKVYCKVGPVNRLIVSNCIGACFLYKKEVYQKNKGYNENLFLVEDYDFWMRSMLNFKFVSIHESLYTYRLHTNSLTYAIFHSDNAEHNTKYLKNLKILYQLFFSEIIKSQKEQQMIYTLFSDVIVDRVKKINFKTICKTIQGKKILKNHSFLKKKIDIKHLNNVIFERQYNALTQGNGNIFLIIYFILINKKRISLQQIKSLIKIILINIKKKVCPIL